MQNADALIDCRGISGKENMEQYAGEALRKSARRRLWTGFKSLEVEANGLVRWKQVYCGLVKTNAECNRKTEIFLSAQLTKLLFNFRYEINLRASIRASVTGSY